MPHITPARFETSLHLLPLSFESTRDIAIAVSGGADSMALFALLYHWAKKYGITVHALTVDHGLRPESANEAMHVQTQILKYKSAQHKILNWSGKKPKTRIQERARDARYKLMADYCTAHNIKHLFLAHHADDQMETVLFRLAKGSGLKGLSGMKPITAYSDTLQLIRPLLGFDKDELIATCQHHNLDFVYDPSNHNQAYARPRMRQSRALLENEGFSEKRIYTTAKRLARAEEALTHYTDTFLNARIQMKSESHSIDFKSFLNLPNEIGVRVLCSCINIINPANKARMEKIEDLHHALTIEKPFKKRTLGGAIFTLNAKNGTLDIKKEHS